MNPLAKAGAASRPSSSSQSSDTTCCPVTRRPASAVLPIGEPDGGPTAAPTATPSATPSASQGVAAPARRQLEAGTYSIVTATSLASPGRSPCRKAGGVSPGSGWSAPTIATLAWVSASTSCKPTAHSMTHATGTRPARARRTNQAARSSDRPSTTWSRTSARTGPTPRRRRPTSPSTGTRGSSSTSIAVDPQFRVVRQEKGDSAGTTSFSRAWQSVRPGLREPLASPQPRRGRLRLIVVVVDYAARRRCRADAQRSSTRSSSRTRPAVAREPR